MQFPWIEFALADNALTPVKATGATALKATDGMVQARVSIKTHIVNIGVPQDALPKQRTSNCTYSRYPCSLVDRIDFSVDGKNVFAARSVFADLADIEGAGLKNDGNDFILSLKCGDASEAYNVTIRFNSTQVLDRKISDPRTGYVLQETRYSPLELLN
jgi:hypothetical protein